MFGFWPPVSCFSSRIIPHRMKNQSTVWAVKFLHEAKTPIFRQRSNSRNADDNMEATSAFTRPIIFNFEL
jgi:hypothetical protein